MSLGCIVAFSILVPISEEDITAWAAEEKTAIATQPSTSVYTFYTHFYKEYLYVLTYCVEPPDLRNKIESAARERWYLLRLKAKYAGIKQYMLHFITGSECYFLFDRWLENSHLPVTAYYYCY